MNTQSPPQSEAPEGFLYTDTATDPYRQSEDESIRETISCPFCTSELDASAKKCRHCGEWVARACTGCGTPLRGEWAASGVCVQCRNQPKAVIRHQSSLVVTEPKSRGVAALSAFFLGGLGTHRFYLGSPLAGVFYLMFFWTFIPTIIGVVEGVRFAVMDDNEFHLKYSGQPLEHFDEDRGL